MTVSALFSVEGSTAVQAHAVAYGATADFAIQSLTGINTISWSIVGSSKASQTLPTITLAGTPSGATASCPMPADPGDGLGRSFIMKLTVTDGAGGSDTSYRVFGAANSAGIIPVCNGEENYRSSTHGYTDVFNQALNAIGGAAGSSGQLLYNNAGAIDGASGITVVGSETALAFGSIPATATGLLRFPKNTVMIAARDSANSFNQSLFYTDGSDNLIVGDYTASTGTAGLYYDVRSGGSHTLRIANTNEFVFNSTSFLMKDNFISFNDTAASSGKIRLANNPGAVIGYRSYNSTNRILLNLAGDGSTFDDAIVGDSNATDGNSTIYIGAKVQAIIQLAAGNEYIFSTTAFDLNGNNLQEVGDFDHDGTNLGFYGTAPTTKKTVTGSKGANAALTSLMTQLAAIGLFTDSTT